MSLDIKPPSKKKIVDWEAILVNTSRGDIARKLQLFHNYSALLGEYTSYHFKIIGGIPQIYARYCKEKVILRV